MELQAFPLASLWPLDLQPHKKTHFWTQGMRMEWTCYAKWTKVSATYVLKRQVATMGCKFSGRIASWPHSKTQAKVARCQLLPSWQWGAYFQTPASQWVSQASMISWEKYEKISSNELTNKDSWATVSVSYQSSTTSGNWVEKVLQLKHHRTFWHKHV